jgi:hypothetical protein
MPCLAIALTKIDLLLSLYTLIHNTAWCNRIIRVKVYSGGQYEGRVGVLTGRRKNDGPLQVEMRNIVIDELASAMRTSKIVSPPPDPPSAFVLYMRAQEREEGDDGAESLRKGHQLYLNLLPEDKDEYIRDACNLKVIREKHFAL